MAMLLSIIMVCLLLLVTAMAATELVSPIKDLGVSYTEGDTISWSIDGGNIVGSVKAETGCSTSAASTTLTLTNNKSVSAT